jgi:hypothetical protein
MLRTVIPVALIGCLLVANASGAEENHSDGSINPAACAGFNAVATVDCTPTIDCTPKLDTRACTRPCLFRDPFGGGCLAGGPDLACEAAKASQNSLVLSAKASCEARKSEQKSQCEAAKASAKAAAEICAGLLK